METVTGIIEEIEKIKELKQGKDKSGTPWALYGTGIIVSGQRYGLTDFDKQSLENKIRFLALRDKIEFKAEQKGLYWNIPQDFEVKVLSHANPPEKKSVPQQPAAQSVSPKTPQKKLETYSDKEIIEKSKALACELVNEETTANGDRLVDARLTVYEQLMLDRRTITIEKFRRGE